MPHRVTFVHTVMLSVIHYLAIVASLTTLVMFFINPTPLAMKVFILSLAFSAFTWFIAYFKRRHTHCSLCKGTPLINSGALPHQKAIRFFPFNHGVTAILSIIATQKFNCMYCGTDFDMLKTPSYKRTGEGYKNQDQSGYSEEDDESPGS